MTHPFGDLVAQHLHRKHGLSQSKLAAGILQAPPVITAMCKGKRLTGPQARERVLAIIGWLHQQGALTTLNEAIALLGAAGMASLNGSSGAEAALAQALHLEREVSTSRLARRHNLPTQLTAFIGREQELAELTSYVQTKRLLNLTGPGGIGKTRLAVEVVGKLKDEFADGVWLVELASLADPALVPQAVTALFHLPDQSGRTHVEALITYLEEKQLVLILDNCEHLIAACADLAERLLRACPLLHILATSREMLRVTGETTWRVLSLTTPQPVNLPPLDQVHQYEAIQLFLQQAALVQPGFTLTSGNLTAVVQICHRLDGIPLAIEMAAAQVAALSVEEIVAGLCDQFALLTMGSRAALPRHRTLRATLDWSYNLLGGDEQVLLAQLSVFVGGWATDAVKAVCTHSQTLPVLLQLVHKSLVATVSRDGQTRYRLLDTVRQYASEKLCALGADEEHALRYRHLSFYLELAQAAELKLHTEEAGQWLERLDAEVGNIRTAFDWAFANGEATSGLHLVASLEGFWNQRGQLGREQMLKALALSDPAERTSVRAKVLTDAGQMQWSYGCHDEGRRMLQEALSIAVELGDQSEIAHASLYLGWEAYSRGDLTKARSFCDDALKIRRDLGDKFRAAVTLIALAAQAEHQSDYDRARSLLEEAIGLLAEVGDKGLQGRPLYRLGRLALRQDDYAKATALCEQSLRLIIEVDSKQEAASCLATFASIAVARGQNIRATQLLGAVEAVLKELGARIWYGDRANYEHDLSVLRTQLDEAAFKAARAQGRAMTFDQAVEYALMENAGHV